MNYRMICRLLCAVLRIVAAFMIPAALISLYYREMSSLYGFLITIGLMLALSCLSFVWKPRKKTFYAREGFVLASLSWVMMSVVFTGLWKHPDVSSSGIKRYAPFMSMGFPIRKMCSSGNNFLSPARYSRVVL